MLLIKYNIRLGAFKVFYFSGCQINFIILNKDQKYFMNGSDNKIYSYCFVNHKGGGMFDKYPNQIVFYKNSVTNFLWRI